MIELTHIRRRHPHVACRRRQLRRGNLRPIAAGGFRGFGAARNRLYREAARAAAPFNRTLDARHGMLSQQLQDTDELTDAGRMPVPLFQVLTQLRKNAGQLPVAKDIGMIQRGWAPAERGEVMPRIDHV